MSYLKDKDAATRGPGAIAARDMANPRAAYARQAAKKRATMVYDQRVVRARQDLGDINLPFGNKRTGGTIGGGAITNLPDTGGGSGGNYGGSGSGYAGPPSATTTSGFWNKLATNAQKVLGGTNASLTRNTAAYNAARAGYNTGSIDPGYGRGGGTVFPYRGGGGAGSGSGASSGGTLTPPQTDGGVPVPGASGGGSSSGSAGSSGGGGGGGMPGSSDGGGGGDPGSDPGSISTDTGSVFDRIPGGKMTAALAAVGIGYLLLRKRKG